MRLTSNTDAVVRRTRDLVSRQVPFATAKALTATVMDAQRNVEKRIERAFDRPTSFTKKAVFIRPARKGRLIAAVGIKDRQAQYLKIQETGGTRTPKKRAIVLPVRARVNRYGNIPRGAVARALARPDTFSDRIGGVGGVWQRQKRGGPRLLFAWESEARYSPRLRFRETARKTVEARFPEQFRRAMAEAIRTAR